tara:strand:- start:9360 stop:9545 length:186 start_codon:yes stop_codon:yes gene_type:complete
LKEKKMKMAKVLITEIFILFGLVSIVNARENESAMSTTLTIKGVASSVFLLLSVDEIDTYF